MAEIAAALQSALMDRRRSGRPGTLAPRAIASGAGWRVADVICTCGAQDEVVEERHSELALGVVTAGTFMYRSPRGRAVMTPGSIMLGNPGDIFECSHEHSRGDRCVAFWYAPEYIERLAADLGMAKSGARFSIAALPALRDTAPVVARDAAALFEPDAAWSERALQTAARVLTVAAQSSRMTPARISRGVAARVSDVVRFIDEAADAQGLTLDRLANRAALSPFHFLRTFTSVTGVTPHHYVRRTKLRRAAVTLTVERARVIDVALDCGFGDVSALNRAFRTEFGVSPRQYRRGR